MVLVLVLASSAAAAEICAKSRPDWNGVPMSALDEALALALSPVSVVLLVLSVAALRFRNQWLGLTATLGWTAFVSFLSIFASPTVIAGRLEGCFGSPALFIGVVIALCAGMVIYTAPLRSRSDNGEN